MLDREYIYNNSSFRSLVIYVSKEETRARQTTTDPYPFCNAVLKMEFLKASQPNPVNW